MSQQPLFGSPPAALANCSRCKVLVRVADPSDRNPDARFIRLAKRPKGLCLECAVAEFFVVAELRRHIRDPKVLLVPGVQEQFAAVLRSGFSDAAREAINWQRVVDNWDLPFPGDGKVRGLSTAKEQDAAAARVSRVAQRDSGPRLRMIRGGKSAPN